MTEDGKVDAGHGWVIQHVILASMEIVGSLSHLVASRCDVCLCDRREWNGHGIRMESRRPVDENRPTLPAAFAGASTDPSDNSPLHSSTST